MNRVNARIDAALARKLARVRRLTGQSVTAIVRNALVLYFERVTPGETGSGDVLLGSGFVGCADGSPDLSSSYKSHVTEKA